MKIVIALTALLFVFQLASMPLQQTPDDPKVAIPDTSRFSDAKAIALLPEIDPRVVERKRQLRAFQRTGYARTLAELMGNDALMALISSLKTNLIIEYAISHVPFEVDIAARKFTHKDTIDAVVTPFVPVFPPVPHRAEMSPIYMDWHFPEDPWRRE